MIEYTTHFLVALPLNMIIEGAVLLFCIRKIFRIDSRNTTTAQLLIVCAFANTLTLPYVWYVFPILIYHSYSFALVIGEITAVILEALFYFMFLRIDLKRAMGASFLANSASYIFVSLLIRAVF